MSNFFKLKPNKMSKCTLKSGNGKQYVKNVKRARLVQNLAAVHKWRYLTATAKRTEEKAPPGGKIAKLWDFFHMAELNNHANFA